MASQASLCQSPNPPNQTRPRTPRIPDAANCCIRRALQRSSPSGAWTVRCEPVDRRDLTTPELIPLILLFPA